MSIAGSRVPGSIGMSLKNFKNLGSGFWKILR